MIIANCTYLHTNLNSFAISRQQSVSPAFFVVYTRIHSFFYIFRAAILFTQQKIWEKSGRTPNIKANKQTHRENVNKTVSAGKQNEENSLSVWG